MGKQLTRFYQILTGLWLADFDEAVFETNISQLDPIFKLCESSKVHNPETKAYARRAFLILRGIFKSAIGHSSFNRVFDWFYPVHFQIIEKSLQTFVQDEEMVYLIFKFANDLLNN